MLRNALFAGTVLAVWAAVSPPAAAQGPVRGAAQGTANAAAWTAGRVRNLIGSRAVLDNNTAAGTVEDIVYDPNGQIDYLVVGNDGKLMTVPWQAARYNAEQKVTTITATPQVWQAVPTYTTTTYPDFYAPTYQQQIYKVYGLTPGQARRVERRIERNQP